MAALDARALFGAGGRPRVVGCEGESLDAVESTMDVARRRAAEGAPDGFVVLAERQRTGRGRTGGWDCPAGEGLLLSVVLRRGVRAADRFLLGLLGAVAATEAVREFLPSAGIKWPNDIVATEGSTPLRVRKLGGVIVEPVTQGDAAPAHVLGLGLNVNQDRRRLPTDTPLAATSLKAELGREVDRTALCTRVLARLDHWYGRLCHERREELLARWRTLSALVGHRVRVRTGGAEIEGTVAGLRATGELILHTDDGAEHLLTSDRAKLVF